MLNWGSRLDRTKTKKGKRILNLKTKEWKKKNKGYVFDLSCCGHFISTFICHCLIIMFDLSSISYNVILFVVLLQCFIYVG